MPARLSYSVTCFAEITNNTIVAVDLSARECGAPARSLIDLNLSQNVSITDNIIERITLDAAASSIVYFWNDTGVSGYAGNEEHQRRLETSSGT